ncbi:MAG: zeta toxin family protein [Stenotrophobium sp.]
MSDKTIWVLAGTNGAGKSSIGGAALLSAGLELYNPDQITRDILRVYPDRSPEQANAEAWQRGTDLLRAAIAESHNFAFETTLGGDTITNLLDSAIQKGLAVQMWYCALTSPELHIQRVRARVKRGGHDIPEGKIRERYDASRRNLIRLIPGLATLRLYDNSEEARNAPRPRLILATAYGRAVNVDIANVPAWAKPIVAAAMIDI